MGLFNNRRKKKGSGSVGGSASASASASASTSEDAGTYATAGSTAGKSITAGSTQPTSAVSTSGDNIPARTFTSDSSKVLQISQSSNISIDASSMTPRVTNQVGIKRPSSAKSAKSVESTKSAMSVGSSKIFGSKSTLTITTSDARSATVMSPTADSVKSPAFSPLSVSSKENNDDISEFAENSDELKEFIVDYDVKPSLLYKFIEYKDWNEAMERCKSAPEEAKTWVVRYEAYNASDETSEHDNYEHKQIRWKMLPIHVAVIFDAPVKLVTMLLEAFPEGINAVDDRKMLPLHLCCRNLTNVSVAQFLVLKDTDTLKNTDYKGRTALAILKEYRDKDEGKRDKQSKLEMKNRLTLMKLIRGKMVHSESEEDSDSEGSDGGSYDEKSTYENLTKGTSGDTTSNSTILTADLGENLTNSSFATVSANRTADSKKSSQTAKYLGVAPSSDSILKNKVASPSAQNSIDNATRSASSRSGYSSRPKQPPRKPRSFFEGEEGEDSKSLEPVTIVPKEEVKKNYIKRDLVVKTAPSSDTKTPSTTEVDYDTKPSTLIKLIEKKLWAQAKARCIERPDEASTWMCRLQEVKGADNKTKEVKWKILPIHSAIVLHSPVEIIEALVDAYPQGLRKGDDRKMLPLHMAFRLGSSPETTAILVDSYPDALKKKDSKGHTPLHILKAYRRKYEKERAASRNGSQLVSNTDMDRNRRKLIKFYLGGRKYGEDDETTLAPFDSDDESELSEDESTIIFENEDEYAYDRLFYRNMFTDFGNLAAKGILYIPGMVRDTLACHK